MDEMSLSFLSPTTRDRLLYPVPGTFAEIEVVSGDEEGHEARRSLPIPPEILHRIMVVLQHTGHLQTLRSLAFTCSSALFLGSDLMYGKLVLGTPYYGYSRVLQQAPRDPSPFTSWTLAAADLGWIRELEFGPNIVSWPQLFSDMLDLAWARGNLRHVVTSNDTQSEQLWTKFAKDYCCGAKLAKWTIKICGATEFGWAQRGQDLAVERVAVSLDLHLWTTPTFFNFHNNVGDLADFFATLGQCSRVSVIDAPASVIRKCSRTQPGNLVATWIKKLGWARFGMVPSIGRMSWQWFSYANPISVEGKWVPSANRLPRVDFGLWLSADVLRALELLPTSVEHINIGCVFGCNIKFPNAIETIRQALLSRRDQLKRIDVHFAAACRQDKELHEVWRPLAGLLKVDGITMTVKCGNSWPKLEELDLNG